MPQITNWNKEKSSPYLKYINRKTGAIAVAYRPGVQYEEKWRSIILTECYYPIASHCTSTKSEAKNWLIDQMTDAPAPKKKCDVCDSENISFERDGACVGYQCEDCGNRPPKIHVPFLEFK